jgi:predicted O-methyltransferase YrrM
MKSSVNNYYKIVMWFINRPALYPEAYRRIKNQLMNKQRVPAQKEESQNYCQKHAISTQAAYSILSGRTLTTSVYEIFHEEFMKAKIKEEDCPIKLGKAGDLELLYWFSEFLEAKNIIETGVASGWSTLALLLSLSHRRGSKLISTDMPCFGVDEETSGLSSDSYVGLVVPEYLKSNWKLHRQADREALPKALKEFPKIDLCHYDSDKRYEGRMWAYPLLWSALRTGGVFISDDVSDNMAFIDFSKKINVDPLIIKFTEANNNIKYIGVIIKK